MSWKIDRSVIGTGPRGEIANTELIEHSSRFGRGLRHVADGVWCYIGAGLSNITFIEAPDGLIVIDSGDCREEAAEALAAMRQHSDAPLRAMLWSHYHYVQGSAVYVDDAGGRLDIWSHIDSARLLAEVGAELGPVRLRGIVSQFAIALPGDGPDALPNAGLGPFWKDPDRPRATPGYVPPNRSIDGPTELTIAGERIVATPIPSDSDDTLVLWFPDRKVCVNNHLWPALFNIFAMRGETYRDPIERLAAFDLMLGYAPEHLVGVHGPPISGVDTVRTALTDYRDSIQFLWDQTVRGMNAGLTLGQLVEQVQLPARFGDAYYTTELYGMAQHHVRQIHAGVRGWFDGDAVNLFPLPEAEEAARIVTGFGGRDTVLEQARAALADDEPAWAVQLATYLLRLDPDDADGRAVKAGGLRLIAQTVPSANARSWCTTQALELEGALSLDGFRVHHLGARRVLESAPHVYVQALKVQLEPTRADFEFGVQWRFVESGTAASLRIRRGVAVPGVDDRDADATLELDLRTWADLYAGTVTAADAEAAGSLTITGDRAGLARYFDAFDHPHLATAFTRPRGV